MIGDILFQVSGLVLKWVHQLRWQVHFDFALDQLAPDTCLATVLMERAEVRLKRLELGFEVFFTLEVGGYLEPWTISSPYTRTRS